MVNAPRHTLTLWTNDPDRAAWADAAGVDRIGLDLETLGKAKRQEGLPTWISPHRFEDLARIRPGLKHATLFVRANPLHDGSRDEIEALADARVGVVMLPNFQSSTEVGAFLDLARGRFKVAPLVERLAAIETIARLPALGIEEIHVGLNDLSIDLGLNNRLGALVSPAMDRIAAAATHAGLKLGVGGLGRALDTDLPVASDLVYAQQIRLGATGALIARSFFSANMDAASFAREIGAMRARLAFWADADAEALEHARAELARVTAGS
ncbi:MAG TPA: hypothetical protein VG841_02910 [Caulobacterales bacterium]|nr:hypothetical protein [Caulobacterales bacterium]